MGKISGWQRDYLISKLQTIQKTYESGLMFGRSGLFYPHGEVRSKENAKNELLILYSN